MPNPIAWLVLLSTPIVAIYLAWRYPPQKAAMIGLFGAAMFWPCGTGLNLPILPDLDKEILPALSMLFALLVFAKGRRKLLKTNPFTSYEVAILVAIVGVFGTIVTNGDDLRHGPIVLPAQGFQDLLNNLAAVAFKWFPPFYLGHALFKTSKDLRTLMKFMVFAGLVYSVPIWIELRLSPQLHNWIYGFHQSDFVQTIRYGGYRPKVLMRHGLNVALFMTMTLIAAGAFYRTKTKLSRFWTPKRSFIYLAIVLVLCKSTGAYFHAAVAIPLVLWGPTWLGGGVTFGLATLIIGYPLFRTADLIPVDEMIDWLSENVNEERALSLWFRFYTEGNVLENTRERFLFGWGGYSRYCEFDQETGEMLSILDGYWVIEIGEHGLVGFLAIFGLMLMPVFRAVRALPKIERKRDRHLLMALALMSALYVFDWVPNSSISADLTFMVGALGGLVPGMLREQELRKRAARKERRERAAAAKAARAAARARGEHVDSTPPPPEDQGTSVS